MSSSEGNFDIARIDMCQTLVLVAAGTGLTPMLRIINYVLQKDIQIVLLFFNKTQKDILCREELQIISDKHK